MTVLVAFVGAAAFAQAAAEKNAYEGSFVDAPDADVRVVVRSKLNGERRARFHAKGVPLTCSNGETPRRDFRLGRLGFFKPSSFGLSRGGTSGRVFLKGRVLSKREVVGWLHFEHTAGTITCSTQPDRFRWIASS